MNSESTQPVQKKISVHDFYFETPLYDVIESNDIDGNIFSGTVDGFSHNDKRETTYKIDKIDLRDYTYRLDGLKAVTLTDKRADRHDLTFFVVTTDDNERIVKVGQIPSLATVQYADIVEKYQAVMNKADMFMLKRAIGLAAHGTGIGSYVYLRRILENLINETFASHTDDIELKEEDFGKLRTKEKIQKLKKFLPASMAKLTPLYGILSKGIHELTEQECLAYFDTMKLAIELILRQKIEQKRQQDEENETIRRMQAASQQLLQKEKKDD